MIAGCERALAQATAQPSAVLAQREILARSGSRIEDVDQYQLSDLCVPCSACLGCHSGKVARAARKDLVW